MGMFVVYKHFMARLSLSKLLVAVENDWELRQLDVKQAFIQANGCGDKIGRVVKLNMDR